MSDISEQHEAEYYGELGRLQGEVQRLRAALEKIANVSQFNRPGGPIVMSEHYEAAWLDCVETAKEALRGNEESKGERRAG